jgi:hypothetical protein
MMRIKETFSFWSLPAAALVLIAAAAMRVSAQAPAPGQQQHVVTSEELQQDAARPAQTRQEDESTVRGLLNTPEGQEALKRAKADYQRVDRAIGQLSDDDLAKFAARSRQAQEDFAAGRLGSTLLIVIILIIVLAIALAVVF